MTGLRTGGYPQKSNGDATTGLIAVAADTDLYPILKAQEVALSNGILSANDEFYLKEFSIKVDSQTWIEVNGGTQIGVHPDDGFFSFDMQRVLSLVVKDDTNLKIAYAY